MQVKLMETNMVRQVFVDKDICIGCSVCSTACHEVFEVRQDPERNGDVKSFTSENCDHEKYPENVQKAIDTCPVQCISWKNKAVASVKT